MSNYTKTINFALKDALLTGDPNKTIFGAELNTEFNNIETASATKANTASPTFTGTVTLAVLSASGNATIGGTLDVTGNITTSGTVDGRDIAADGALLDTASQPGDNISDFTNDSGYLTTIGTINFADLGTTPTTLAGYGITDAATSAQGDLADTALQPSDNVSDLTNDANYVAEGNTPSENDILVYNEVPPRWEAVDNLANRVTFTANGNIVATNVQDAIEELDDEKAPITTTVTLAGTQTLTNKTFTGMVETVDTLATSGSITLTDTAGGIKVLNANGNVTFSDGLNAGESLTLMVRQSTGTITWPTVEWLNNGNAAPTVVATLYTGVVLWKVGSVVYGAVIGTEA